MPHDQKTQIALEGAIKKWEQIASGTRKDKGADDCHLCLIFNKPNMPSAMCCVGCPVRSRTGKRHCANTPYMEFIEAETKENAEAELNFLRSLREPAIQK